MAEKKKSILKKVVAITIAGIIFIGGAFAAWKLLKKNPDKDPTQLRQATNITVVYDQKTGEGMELNFVGDSHADSHDITVKQSGKNGKTVETLSVTENKAELADAKYVKDGDYTVTITSKGSGDYKDSAPTTYEFTYSYTPEGEIQFTQLVMSDMTFDKETQRLSWAPVEGVRTSESYEIVIKNPQGEVVDTFNTSATNISLAALGLPEVDNAATATGTAKAPSLQSQTGDIKITDSNPKTAVIDNSREAVVDPEEEEMKAFAKWEEDFKVKVGTSLSGPGVNPVVSEINAIEIKDSTNAGRSTITVFATYTESGATAVGSVSYEIDKVTGVKYQNQLDDINLKVAKGNIVTGSRQFTTINPDVHLIKELAASTKLPTNSGLYQAKQAGATITSIVDGVSNIGSGGGFKGFDVVGLIKVNNDVYNIAYGVYHNNDGSTNDQIYNAFANNSGKIVSVEENKYNKLDESVKTFLELRERHETYIMKNGKTGVTSALIIGEEQAKVVKLSGGKEFGN